MRLTSSISALTLLACNTQLVAANVAYILGYDSRLSLNTDATPLKSLSPSTARIVLAQRLGVEDFHTSQGLTQEEIDAINTYGARTSMFDSHGARDQAIILAPYKDVDLTKHILSHTVFTVEDAPTYSATEDLFQDLILQTDAVRTERPARRSSDYLYRDSNANQVAPFVHASEGIEAAIMKANKLAKDNFIVTVVLVEDEADARAGSWGSYETPGSTLHKRQSPHRLQDEEPLSAFASVHSIAGVHVFASNGSNSTNSTNNKPLHGILPACYSTRSSCESTTRGCTGHGSCSLKYTNDDAQSRKECWACACNATQSNGLTTYWTGPACQKKDISVEFWLITLFTIGLVSLVGFAVGTIWSMGEEDLPSVIGAGVSGPTARK